MGAVSTIGYACNLYDLRSSYHPNHIHVGCKTSFFCLAFAPCHLKPIFYILHTIRYIASDYYRNNTCNPGIPTIKYFQLARLSKKTTGTPNSPSTQLHMPDNGSTLHQTKALSSHCRWGNSPCTSSLAEPDPSLLNFESANVLGVAAEGFSTPIRETAMYAGMARSR